MCNRKICVHTFCSLVLTQPQRVFFTATIFRLNRRRRTTKHPMIYVRAQFEWVAPADSSVFNSRGSRPSFTSVFPDNIDKHTATCASFTRLFPEVFVSSSSFNSLDGPRRRGPQARQTWYRSKFVSAFTFWFWFTVVGLVFLLGWWTMNADMLSFITFALKLLSQRVCQLHLFTDATQYTPARAGGVRLSVTIWAKMAVDQK